MSNSKKKNDVNFSDLSVKYQGGYMYLDKKAVLKNGLRVIANGVKSFKEEQKKLNKKNSN